MANVAFDTLKSVERLRSANFSDKQARMIVNVQKEILSDVLSHSVAKTTDILLLKHEMSEFKSELKQEMSEFKSELKQEMSELKHEMSEFKSEIKEEIFDFKVEVRKDYEDLKSTLKINHWILGLVMAGITTILVKLFLPQLI